MTVTSASPAHLAQFVDTGGRIRRTLDEGRSTVAALECEVSSNCADVRVESNALDALATVLGSMEANELFVTTVHDALVEADGRDPADVVVVETDHIRTALDRAGAAVPPSPVELDPVELVGLPMTSGFVDDPICAANGNMVHQDLDLTFPGVAAALDLRRTYNSLTGARDGAFGHGMSSMLDVRVVASPGEIEVHLADGAIVRCVVRPDGSGCGIAGRRVLDVVTTDDGHDVRLDERHTLHTDAAGRLTGWTHGVARVEATRDSSGRIVTLSERRSGRRIHLDWTDGHVAQAATDDGRTVTYTYGTGDADGRLVRVSTSCGRLTYEWDGAFLAAVVDADGVRPFRNEYDDIGRVVRQIGPFGRTTTYRYERGGLTVITDQTGVRQAMVHDRRGNLTAVIDTDGSAMRFTYDQADRCTRVVDRDGATWSYEFGTDGRLVGRTDPDGLGVRWTRDVAGRVTSLRDRAGGVTRFDVPADPALTTPTRVTAPDGSTIDIDVDPTLDRPTRVVDADGVITSYEYDADGQLVATIDGLGHRTELTYDDAGRLVRRIDPDGLATTVEYEAGRITRVDRGGTVATFVRSAAGRIVGGTDPGIDEPWSVRLGDHGAPIELTDALGSTIHLDHDPIGNLTAVTTADGDTFHHFYDELGRLVGAADPSGATSHRTYDRAGRIVSLTDAEGRVWRRDVDLLGRTVRSIAPDGSVTELAYHPGGQVRSVRSSDGAVWISEVDHAGRVVAVTDPSGRVSTCTYSAAGRLVERRPFEGPAETYEYDDAGRPVARVCDCRRREVVLDERGRALAVAVDGEQTVTVERDRHGRITVRRTPTRADRCTYDPAGRPLEIVDGTGATRRYSWTATGLLAEATDPAGDTLAYTYDVRGRLVAQHAPGDRTTTFAYDPGGRLAILTDPAGVRTTFSYDHTGLPRRQQTGRSWSDHDRTVGSESRLLAHALGCGQTTTERRDAAGRILAGEDGSVYEYDHAGRLARVEHPDRTETRYEYGADGLLAVEHTPSGRRRYVYDHGGRVVTVTDDVAGVTSYDYDEVGRRVGEHHPDGSTVGYEWRGLSRLVAIDRIDHTGVHHHTPCAELALTAPTADDVRLAFLGARVLDLDTHQFLSPDPLLPVPATPGAASAYTHAWYDPVNHVDPTGRRPIALDDWDTMRAREENGLVGEFVDAVLADPWATIAAIGITAAGATLCFTPLAPVGAGILIGVGSSAALGFATGTFDPRDVVVAGLFGALGGAAAQAARVGAVSWQASVATQAAIGGGEELARQTVAGEGYDAMSIGGALLSAGVAPALDELLPADTIISRLARDTGGNVIAGRVDGMLTGEPLTLRGLAIDVSGGVITANSGHYIDRRLAVEVPELGADLDLRPSILDDPAALRATTRAVVSDLLVGTAVGRLSDQLHAAP